MKFVGMHGPHGMDTSWCASTDRVQRDIEKRVGRFVAHSGNEKPCLRTSTIPVTVAPLRYRQARRSIVSPAQQSAVLSDGVREGQPAAARRSGRGRPAPGWRQRLLLEEQDLTFCVGPCRFRCGPHRLVRVPRPMHPRRSSHKVRRVGNASSCPRARAL